LTKEVNRFSKQLYSSTSMMILDVIVTFYGHISRFW